MQRGLRAFAMAQDLRSAVQRANQIRMESAVREALSINRFIGMSLAEAMNMSYLVEDVDTNDDADGIDEEGEEKEKEEE